jgi:hypothetical protein
MLHATKCRVQFVLCNYINLQLHVSHVTEFYLQTTIAKPKISSSDTWTHSNQINYKMNIYKP